MFEKFNYKIKFPCSLKKGFTKLQTESFFLNLNKLVNCYNCYYVIPKDFDLKLYERILQSLHQVGYTVDKIMAEVAQPCSSLAKKCIWNGQQKECTTLFSPVKSTNGYCCTFNYYGSKSFQ